VQSEVLNVDFDLLDFLFSLFLLSKLVEQAKICLNYDFYVYMNFSL